MDTAMACWSLRASSRRVGARNAPLAINWLEAFFMRLCRMCTACSVHALYIRVVAARPQVVSCSQLLHCFVPHGGACNGCIHVCVWCMRVKQCCCWPWAGSASCLPDTGAGSGAGRCCVGHICTSACLLLGLLLCADARPLCELFVLTLCDTSSMCQEHMGTIVAW